MINSLELVAIPLLQPSKHWDYRVSHSIFFYFFGLKKTRMKKDVSEKRMRERQEDREKRKILRVKGEV